MKKILGVALVAALALGSSVACAADSYGFVNVGVGQAVYHEGRTDNLGFKLDEKDTAGSFRVGAAWRGPVDFGVEGGYVNLGDLVSKYDSGDNHAHDTINAKGWLLGVNATRRFESPWYLQVRGGWFRSTVDEDFRYTSPFYDDYFSGSASGDGWYAGIGGGYDFSHDFSIGLNYDNYHAVAKVDGDKIGGNVSAFTVQLECRF